MKKSLVRKGLVLGIIILLLGILVGPAVNAIKIENEQLLIPTAEKDGEFGNLNSYTNISVEVALMFLTDTANGIQIPIDVRYNYEWKAEHIDTPIPENPRHYCLTLLKNEILLQQFMTLYENIDIILYCNSGGRSAQAAQILSNNGFTGTIYNMLGGIEAWKTAGYPTISGGFLDITVEEAWELLNDTANGIQVPIDVRTYEEWLNEHIDTPHPENASHHPLSDMQDEEKLQEFMTLYTGREIVLYCKNGTRSLMAAEILVDNEFTGTIYNMLGGIEAWKDAGYPIVPAEPDLSCHGSLSWINVKPGDTVTGNFTVENVGFNGSLLDWEITDWPNWGHGSSWTFSPISGKDLLTEDGPITVEVTCKTPNVKNKNLTSAIKVQNLENPDDFCYINVTLTTPKNKYFIYNFPLLNWLLEHFSLTCSLIRHFLRLIPVYRLMV